MKGKHRVIVSTKRLRYDFVLKRNITVIRGDSATGKTTLIDMVQEYGNHPSESPVELICDKSCFVLSGTLWKEQLSGMQDSIVFIDEGNEFVRSDEFARKIQNTDNYYVIATREGLPALPYSVEEIYGIRTSGKYGTLKQRHHEFYRIYGADVIKENIKPEKIVTEDSNSGYQFFQAVCNDRIVCDSANGKSNIFHYLKTQKEAEILVVADGAAFGSEIDKVLYLLKNNGKGALYLPESFEWLILKAGVLNNHEIRNILEEPSNYIESENHFSWERFFAVLLVEKTKDTYLAYSKRKLNEAYLSEKVRRLILNEMEHIVID